MKIKFLACAVMLSGFPLFTSAQSPSPDQWDIFISANNDVLVSDTFRIQSFDNSLSDNWNYTVEGRYTIINSVNFGLPGFSNGKLIKLELGSTLRMELTDSPLHKGIGGKVIYAGTKLMKNENMDVLLYHGGNTERQTVCTSPNDNFTQNVKPVNINNRVLNGMDFIILSPVPNSKNGYYGIDSLYLFGDIPAYSLFNGNGDWRDTTAWSHLPAERHRHALIKGQVELSSDIQCDEVSLAGKIQINNAVRFSLNDLHLHETSGFIQNEGELLVNGQVSLTRSFAEKGVWYFVSFPFDVYTDGIDPSFSLKDDKPNSGGNFIYVLTYDSESRSNGQTNRNNWKVLPESAMQESLPVFERGKGYLLAIDESASLATLCFTSQKGSVPVTFGKDGEIGIDIPYLVDENNKHNGWQLCGNPLPTPLHVSQLAHPNLDEYIYYYNGEDYTPIPVNGNYLLPPYSAFFVKARESSTLFVNTGQKQAGGVLLSAASPLHRLRPEPSKSTAAGNTESMQKFYHITPTSFIVKDAHERGTVSIYETSGKQVSIYSFKQEESMYIPLPEKRGFYILLLQTQNRRAEYKFIR